MIFWIRHRVKDLKTKVYVIGFTWIYLHFIQNTPKFLKIWWSLFKIWCSFMVIKRAISYLTMNIPCKLEVAENSKGSRLQYLRMKFWKIYSFPLIFVDQNAVTKYTSFHLNIIEIWKRLLWLHCTTMNKQKLLYLTSKSREERTCCWCEGCEDGEAEVRVSRITNNIRFVKAYLLFKQTPYPV